MGKARIFKSKAFERFASKERIADTTLEDAVWRVERGSIDADLGGGVIKQRVARVGEGKSGGYRALLFFRAGKRAVFIDGFAKSEKENIDLNELSVLRRAAKEILTMEDAYLQELVNQGRFIEVERT